MVVGVTDETRFPVVVSVESSLGYWSQLARAQRRFRKLRREYDPGESHEVLDELIFFFVCCHSIHDWLEHYTPEAFERWKVSTRGWLPWKICRDVSNRFKHLKVRHPSLPHPLTIIREHCDDGQDRMSTIVDGKVQPLYDIAEELMNHLVKFTLTNEGLLPPKGRGI